MLISLVVGLVVGIVLAIPPGPIAVAVIRQALEGQASNGLKVAAGAATMDVVYALVAAFASSAIFGSLLGMVTENVWFMLLFQLACMIVLIVLGIRYFRPTTKSVAETARLEEEQEERAKKLGYSSPYLVGLLIAITNLASPTFLPSLIVTIGFLHSNGWVDDAVGSNVLYGAGFGAGAMLWFMLLTEVLSRLRSRLSPTFIQVIYRFAGGSFILFAAILAYHVAVATEWSRLF